MKPEATKSGRAFAGALFALAALLVLNTALGPLGWDVITYAISASLLDQTIGLEVVTVGLVVPAAVVAGVLALRDRRVAAFIGFGPATYSAYMFLQYVLGPEYSTYTVVAFFHTAIFGLACGVSGWAWTLASRQAMPELAARRRRTSGVIMVLFAAFVLSRYSAAVWGAFTGAALPAEFVEGQTFYWSIFMLDLGVVVPATAAAAVGLFRGARIAHHAMYALVTWYVMVPPSVAAMSATMLIKDDPHASLSQTMMFVGVSALFAVAIAWIYLPWTWKQHRAAPHSGAAARVSERLA